MKGGGDPPHNGGMEARVTTLEEAVKNLPTKADLDSLRQEAKTGFAELRADMHKNTVDIQRWMIATVIGLFLGFGGLFLAMSNALKPHPMTTVAPPPHQQPPIIINIPATSPSTPFTEKGTSP